MTSKEKTATDWSEDDDFALAVQLSQQDLPRQQSVKDRKISIVDDYWEINDPNPDIRALFLEFNQTYFWSKLLSVEVRWSPKMTLCAGLCVYQKKAGYCSIRLSQPLLKFRPRRDLVQTLLHEMIHAYLFVMHDNRDHDAHGPRFLEHMYRINGATGANITVYHSFHDEVNVYRQHWWRCDGPCKDRSPFFGYVKRAMNRPPSKNDPWWSDHQSSCGGTFIKIKEPEGYGEKGKKRKKLKKVDSNQTKITDFHGGNKVKNDNSHSQDSDEKKINPHNDDKGQFVNDDHPRVDSFPVIIPFSGKGYVLGSKEDQPSTSGNNPYSIPVLDLIDNVFITSKADQPSTSNYGPILTLSRTDKIINDVADEYDNDRLVKDEKPQTSFTKQNIPGDRSSERMNNKVNETKYTDKKNNLQVVSLLDTTLKSDSDSRSTKPSNSFPIDEKQRTNGKNNLQVINLLDSTLESDSDSRSTNVNDSLQDNNKSLDSVTNCDDDEILFIKKKPRNSSSVNNSIERKPHRSQHSPTEELNRNVTCPICHRNDISYAIINEHIDNCLVLKQS